MVGSPLLLIVHVTLEKLLNVSGLQFSHLENSVIGDYYEVTANVSLWVVRYYV